VEEILHGEIRVRRLIEEGHEVIQSPLPLAITVTKEINVPRLPSLRGLARAKSARIPTWTAQDVGLDPQKVGLNGSFTKVIDIFFPRRENKAQILAGEPEVQAACLIGKLKENRLI
jgi:electron transfer flavoprotein beta subunit